MTITFRLLQPIQAAMQKINVKGRAYSGSVGSTVDAPDFDAGVLMANGWMAPGPIQGSGATSLRPVTLPVGCKIPAGFTWLDLTMGLTIVWDGATWRNPANGASV